MNKEASDCDALEKHRTSTQAALSCALCGKHSARDLTSCHNYEKVRRAALLTPVFTSLEVVMGVLIPYVTSWIIDRGIMAGNLRNVFLYGMLMLVMAAFSLAFGIMAGRCSAKASTGFAYNLRQSMYANIQTFSFSNIDKFSTAGLITRMTTDVSSLQNAFQTILRASVRAPLNLVFSVLMCVFINFNMSIIFMVALVVLGTALWFIISRTVKLYSQVFLRYDDLNMISSHDQNDSLALFIEHIFSVM